MISAIVGLVVIQGESSAEPSAAGTSGTPPSTSSSTMATRPPPKAVPQQARVGDRRGDTTGPDLVSLSAQTDHRILHVQIKFATRVTGDVVTHLFIDADSDRTTGSLSFPCSAATLGADYEISLRGNRIGPLMSSVRDGCAAAFKPAAPAAITTLVLGRVVRIDVPVLAIHRPGDHVLGLSAQALHSTGGQIDSCPGQHDPSLSVRY